MTDTLNHILAVTQAKPTGAEKWSGHCPAHGSKRHRDLSIKRAGTRILLHCFGGCRLASVCAALGITMRDLFTDALEPDVDKRRAAAHARERKQREHAEEARKQGRHLDALKAADYHIRSRQGLDICEWSNEKLQDELNLLGDAYTLLEAENCNG